MGEKTRNPSERFNLLDIRAAQYCRNRVRDENSPYFGLVPLYGCDDILTYVPLSRLEAFKTWVNLSLTVQPFREITF